MADQKDIASRLRRLVTGTQEWRVQHPSTGDYCMAFSFENSARPERDAHDWLADHRRRFPGGKFSDYEVHQVREFTQLESLALEAAEALEAAAGEVVSEFIIEGDQRRGGADDIRISRCRQAGGGVLWAVRKFGNCLSKQGEWEFEPSPSSRDDEFLARCRFSSSAEALEAARKAPVIA